MTHSLMVTCSFIECGSLVRSAIVYLSVPRLSIARLEAELRLVLGDIFQDETCDSISILTARAATPDEVENCPFLYV